MDELLGALTIANTGALIYLFRQLRLRVPTANPQPVMDERTGEVHMIPQTLIDAVTPTREGPRIVDMEEPRVVDMTTPHYKEMG